MRMDKVMLSGDAFFARNTDSITVIKVNFVGNIRLT